MLTLEENELVTRTGPGTPMGEVMRRYWMPGAHFLRVTGTRLRASARAAAGRGTGSLSRYRGAHRSAG